MQESVSLKQLYLDKVGMHHFKLSILEMYLWSLIYFLFRYSRLLRATMATLIQCYAMGNVSF